MKNPTETCYSRPDRVAVVDIPGTSGSPGSVYLSPLPEGEILVLEGTAAVIWRAATTVSTQSLGARVARALDLKEAEIRDDLFRFVNDLVDRRLLEESRFG